MAGSSLSSANGSALPVLNTIGKLIAVIGEKLTAYLAGRSDVAELEPWKKGEAAPPPEIAAKLRFAHDIVEYLLRQEEAPKTIQAFLMGSNPDLDNKSILRLLHHEKLETVEDPIRRAVEAFVKEEPVRSRPDGRTR